jgi:hypothetical protein
VAPGMPGAVAPGMPGAVAPTPNHAFVQNAIAGAPALTLPGAAPALTLPPAQPTYTPTAAAQGATLEQWLASGQYTVDQLVAAGVFIKS